MSHVMPVLTCERTHNTKWQRQTRIKQPGANKNGNTLKFRWNKITDRESQPRSRCDTFISRHFPSVHQSLHSQLSVTGTRSGSLRPWRCQQKKTPISGWAVHSNQQTASDCLLAATSSDRLYVTLSVTHLVVVKPFNGKTGANKLSTYFHSAASIVLASEFNRERTGKDFRMSFSDQCNDHIARSEFR